MTLVDASFEAGTMLCVNYCMTVENVANLQGVGAVENASATLSCGLIQPLGSKRGKVRCYQALSRQAIFSDFDLFGASKLKTAASLSAAWTSRRRQAATRFFCSMGIGPSSCPIVPSGRTARLIRLSKRSFRQANRVALTKSCRRNNSSGDYFTRDFRPIDAAWLFACRIESLSRLGVERSKLCKDCELAWLLGETCAIFPTRAGTCGLHCTGTQLLMIDDYYRACFLV